jgi:hypothetical protein
MSTKTLKTIHSKKDVNKPMNTKGKTETWEVLDKKIRLSLFTAWELGKRQKDNPYKYNLDTDKLGKPIFDYCVAVYQQGRADERKKIEIYKSIMGATDFMRQYGIEDNETYTAEDIEDLLKAYIATLHQSTREVL